MGVELGIPAGQRKPALIAASTLFATMAGHTLLETARDSLFLARTPVARLPWAYALIAIVALLAVEADRQLRKRYSARSLLSLTLLGGAAGCLAFVQPFRTHASWAPHAFYVWVALIATLAISQFWLMLSESFTVAEAKRVYALVGAGGLLGAMFGGALARASASGGHREGALLLLGAGCLAIAAAIAWLALGKLAQSAAPAAELSGMIETRSAAMRDLRSERYLRRMLGIAVLSTIAVTLADFAFKAEVARRIPAGQLASFFGSLNVGLSAAAVLAQFVIAPQLLHALGVGRALLVLPAVLAFASLGALAAPGLVTYVLLRGADGSLRHSLHRSSIEVLYLPLPSHARARWKLVVDVLGQRGGQALAAGLIVACLAAGLPAWAPLWGVLGSCIAWVVLSASMEGHYLALFRDKIRAGAIETRADVPELDVRSLESLVAALGSDDEEEVLAALDLLVDYDRAQAIPALLLYHPSSSVVVRALEVLANSGRRNFAAAARRLLERPDDEVQAAAMLALAGQMPPGELRRELDAQRPIAARAAVLVAIKASGLDEDGACEREISAGVAPDADPQTRLAFTRAFRLRGDHCCVPFLAPLAHNAGPRLQLELARAMLAMPDVAHVPVLLHMLANRNVRAVAREALCAVGEPALLALGAATGDPQWPRSVRAHLPRSIARFGSSQSADLLLDWFEHESDGWVRFKIIRGLGLLRPHLGSRAHTRRVLAHGRSALVRATQFMAVRLATELDRLADPRLATQCGELLVAVLREKETHAIDRAVRLIGLLHSANGIHNIRQALAHRDRRLRGDGVELLVHKAPQDIARALASLLESGPDATRLARAADALHEPLAVHSYEQRLRLMLADDSEAVRCVAACHVGELGLITLADAVGEAAARDRGMASEVFARVRAALSQTRVAPTQLGTTLYAWSNTEVARGER